VPLNEDMYAVQRADGRGRALCAICPLGEARGLRATPRNAASFLPLPTVTYTPGSHGGSRANVSHLSQGFLGGGAQGGTKQISPVFFPVTNFLCTVLLR
jgi:hypothetical protein